MRILQVLFTTPKSPLSLFKRTTITSAGIHPADLFPNCNSLCQHIHSYFASSYKHCCFGWIVRLFTYANLSLGRLNHLFITHAFRRIQLKIETVVKHKSHQTLLYLNVTLSPNYCSIWLGNCIEPAHFRNVHIYIF